MPLKSRQFRNNERLRQCLVSDPQHILEGARGEHVALIQQALIMLGVGVIDPREISTEFYGPSTARAVLKYKGPPRNIINTHYQLAPDNIVGKMTIAHLDKEMEDFDKVPISKYVSITKQGAPHDHSKCNPEKGICLCVR